MCELCGDEKERQAAISELLRKSASLKILASHLSNLAYGRIKPHTDEVKKYHFIFLSVIRYLVDQWM
jgi:hypothetical protein